MMTSSNPRESRKAFGIACAICVALFALFALMSSTLTKRLDQTANAAALVPKMVADGRTGQALRIARFAAEGNPLDLNAAVLYAETLQTAGQSKKAQEVYQRIFSIREQANPAYVADLHPDSQATVSTERPYFFTEARLAMARQFHEKGDSLKALEDIQLARAFGQTIPQEHHALVAEICAGRQWGMAFDYWDFDKGDLGGISGDARLAFILCAAQRQQWTLCETLAGGLLEQNVHEAQAHFWLGRALLALGRADDARHVLDRAAAQGQGDAPFFLGLARDAAGVQEGVLACYLDTARDSLYRPFALAKAMELLNEDSQDLEEVRAECASYFKAATSLPAPYVPERMPVYPMGLELKRTVLDASTPFTARILWTGSDAKASQTFALRHAPDGGFLLNRGGRTLELRLLRNLVPFGTFEGLAQIPDILPGWPELYRKESTAGQGSIKVVDDGHGAVLRTGCDDAASMTGLRSVPIPAVPERHYLFAAESQSDKARLYVGWNWFTRDDRLVYNHNVLNQVVVPAMAWKTEYTKCPVNASYFEVVVGVYHDVGAALFKATLVFELDPPLLEAAQP